MARNTDPTIHVPADLWARAAEYRARLGYATAPDRRGAQREVTPSRVLLDAIRRGLAAMESGT